MDQNLEVIYKCAKKHKIARGERQLPDARQTRRFLERLNQHYIGALDVNNCYAVGDTFDSFVQKVCLKLEEIGFQQKNKQSVAEKPKRMTKSKREAPKKAIPKKKTKAQTKAIAKPVKVKKAYPKKGAVKKKLKKVA